jgi:mono/diheme cytochrome c family protein
LDLRGKNHELRRAEAKAVVLFFTGNGCPIARKSVDKLKALRQHFGTDVAFWLINTYATDSREECRKEYAEFDMAPLTYLRDPKQAVALVLGVERTAEVVAISTETWRVFYRGAIDDQFTEGAQRPAAERKFLEEALTQFTSGEPIAAAGTQAHGCLVSFGSADPLSAPTLYASRVAPLLRSHCADCHQSGGIGPWAMDSYSHVRDYSRMIQEVLLTGQMPPWHADTDFGHWANDRSLTAEETQLLLQWIAAGSPRGDGVDPLAEPLPSNHDWPLGPPSFTVKLPAPETIPANGVLDYRHVAVELPITNDVWLSGVDIRPGNRLVVHHVIVRAKWPGGPDDGSGYGVSLSGWAPGMMNSKFAAGTGKHLPQGAAIDLEMHYTTVGSPQTDQTEIACYVLADRPERELTTRSAIQTELNIPPGSDEARDAAVYGFSKPATLYTLMPHMHLRGKWMRFELLSPNGQRETLLSVPRYDFNWQTIYRLATPRRVPAGAWLLVTGGFDNSAANPSNPGPRKRVQFGLQSWDEMFIGFFDAADDPIPASARTLSQQTQLPAGVAATR